MGFNEAHPRNVSSVSLFASQTNTLSKSEEKKEVFFFLSQGHFKNMTYAKKYKPLLHPCKLTRHSKIVARYQYFECRDVLSTPYNFWHGCLICLLFVLFTHKKCTVPCSKSVGTVPRFRSAVPDFCASVKLAIMLFLY